MTKSEYEKIDKRSEIEEDFWKKIAEICSKLQPKCGRFFKISDFFVDPEIRCLTNSPKKIGLEGDEPEVIVSMVYDFFDHGPMAEIDQRPNLSSDALQNTRRKILTVALVDKLPKIGLVESVVDILMEERKSASEERKQVIDKLIDEWTKVLNIVERSKEADYRDLV